MGCNDFRISLLSGFQARQLKAVTDRGGALRFVVLLKNADNWKCTVIVYRVKRAGSEAREGIPRQYPHPPGRRPPCSASVAVSNLMKTPTRLRNLRGARRADRVSLFHNTHRSRYAPCSLRSSLGQSCPCPVLAPRAVPRGESRNLLIFLD